MLEVESGSNDPCSYMLTVIILTIMSGELSGSSLVVMIFSQIIFGILVGVVVALAAAFILKKVNFATDGFDTIFVFSMALVSYAGASMINGNGYLAAYIAGIILGNTPLHHKKSLVHFFDGITGLMQMLIFFLLGLLAYPSQLPKILPIALAIAVFLTFVARPVSVFAILMPFRCPVKQQLLVSWAGLRGAASIVFAIMATVSPAYTKNDLFHIVIFIVLFSISIQGTLLGLVAKKLDMIDENGNVMKTFSDYSDEMPVEFVKISIKAGHPWENRKIKDFPAGFITGTDSKRRGAYHSKWQHGSACRRQDCLKCFISGRKSWHLSDRNPNRKRQQVDWKAIIQNKTGRREAGSCSKAE